MARKKTAAPSVSLFPFLAVLICAMGALIFLLLAITRQIRKDAIAELIAPKAVEVTTIEEPAFVPEPIWKPPVVDIVEPEPIAEPERSPAPRPQLISSNDPGLGMGLVDARSPEPRKIIVPNPSPIEPPLDLNAELRAEREQLAALIQKLSTESAATQELKTAADRRVSALSKSIADQRAKVDLILQQKTELNATGRSALDRYRELALELKQLHDAIEKKRAEPEAVENKYRLLAYDGVTGTTRRPIHVECSERGLTFLSEGVTLTPQDLRGFQSRVNPFRAGLAALVGYWIEREPHESAPYVLMIVRPGGTHAFYAARQFIEGFPQPFGYELLSKDVTLDVPAADAEAVTRLKRAINDARIANGRGPRVGTGIAGSERFEGGTGFDGRGRLGARDEEGSTGPFRTGGPTDRVSLAEGGGNSDIEGAFPTERRFGSGQENIGRSSDGAEDSSATPGRFPVAGQDDAKPRFRRGMHGTLVLDRGSDQLPGEKNLPASPWEDVVNSEADRESERRRPSDNEPRTGTGQQPAPREGVITRSMPRPESARPQNHVRLPNGQMVPSRPRSNPTSRTEVASRPASPRVPNFLQNQITDDGRRKVWGKSPNRNGIGIERTVEVVISATAIRIGSADAVQLSDEVEANLLTEIVSALEQEAETWGVPPKEFYWIPRVHFRADQGGIERAKRMGVALEKGYGLSTKLDVATAADVQRRSAQ